jgi:hypothetical protein
MFGRNGGKASRVNFSTSVATTQKINKFLFYVDVVSWLFEVYFKYLKSAKRCTLPDSLCTRTLILSRILVTIDGVWIGE